MQTERPMKPYIVAMTFGETPDLMLHSGIFQGIDAIQAIAIAVSSAYVDRGEKRRLTTFNVTEVLPESIAAMHRGTAGPAPEVIAKDEAYAERNRLVAALAHLFPSGIARTNIPGWEPEWHGCVYIDLPTGQVSWHYHDREAHLFADLPPYHGQWDGHDTATKYDRLRALAARERFGEFAFTNFGAEILPRDLEQARAYLNSIVGTENPELHCARWFAAIRAEAESAERERWLSCARVDAMMEGPALKGWNRSELDRLWLASVKPQRED